MKRILQKNKVLLGAILVLIVLIALYVKTSEPETHQSRADAGSVNSQYAVSSKHNVLQELQPGFNGLKIGDSVKLSSLKTIRGQRISFDELVAEGPVAIVFMGAKCPVSQRYTLRLNRLHEEFSTQGVTILGISSNKNESLKELVRYAYDTGYKIQLVKDTNGEIARQIGATMTPQVFVVDRQSILRYRGAIDDDRYENRVKNHYLKDVLNALVNGKPVSISSTQAFGCTVHLPEPGSSVEAVNYAEHIAPILWKNCQPCHSPGQVAPFSLLTYEDAETWSTEIAHYTQARFMPPWKPVAGFGEFKNERRLSDEEIALIARWAETGSLAGDLKKLPPPPTFSSSWPLGEPDAILEMQETYEIGPEGEDEYRNFVIPTNFDRDMYVQALDIQPGNRNVVHHALVIADMTDDSRKRDAADPKPGFEQIMAGGTQSQPKSWSQKLKNRLQNLLPGQKPKSRKRRQVVYINGWLPGMTPNVLPKGTGALLPKGKDVVLLMHYYRTGKVEQDRSKIGLYFLDEPNPIRVYTKDISKRKFTIPAGEQRYELKPRGTLPEDIYLVSIIPHMHFLGSEMKVTAILPTHEEIPLVWIKNWDFNWQDVYNYKELLFLPKGTEIRVNAAFDNSAGNPRNPNDPPKPVSFGYNTTDEMCAARLIYVKGSDYDLSKEGYSSMNTNMN